MPTDFACHVLLFTSNFSILNFATIIIIHGKSKCKIMHQVTNACSQSRRAIYLSPWKSKPIIKHVLEYHNYNKLFS
nr:hypothetical protein Itr_chr05CG12930 [Ipomoea trifida]